MNGSSSTGAPVLVLNQNYQPLNVCTVRRAVVLLDVGKAELLQNGRGRLRTTATSFPLPSVIRLVYLIRRPLLQRRLSRREVFLRDNFTCLYCGRETRQLTLDHVIPRYRGGAAHVGERGQRLHVLQPPQGGAHAPGGGHASPRRDSAAEAEPVRHLFARAHSRGVAELRAVAQRAPAQRGWKGG